MDYIDKIGPEPTEKDNKIMKKALAEITKIVIEREQEGFIVRMAEKIARYAHKGQIRNRGADKGKPYIIHPERTANKFSDDDMECKSAAWLHDVLEDTDFTREDLLICGVPEEVVKIVESLTKKESENYLDYILKFKLYSNAKRIKLADLEDNMMSLEEGSLKDKYRMAKWILTEG
jgi:(p)ppGpp synthase/HD superfamily hydrolase